MKTILFLKKADLAVQVLALIAGIIAVINDTEGGWSILTCYYFVGAAQLLSLIVNAIIFDRFLWHPGRKKIGIITAVTFITGVFACAASYLIIFYLLALLLFAPVLAAWYGIISAREMLFVQKLAHRSQHAWHQ